MTRTPWILAGLVAWAPLLVAGCDGDGDDTGDTGDTPDPEILETEPAGAPTELADGRLTCVGQNKPAPAGGSSLELTGYVRTLADPSADDEPPAAQVEIFSASGTSLGAAFADSSKDGRVSVTVPVTEDGHTGYAVVTHEQYLDWRFQSSRAVTDNSFDGWTWLVTADERDAALVDLGLTPGADQGTLVGVVHDCDAFGVANAVVTLDGASEGVIYLDGWDVAPERTYTGSSGRFLVPDGALGDAEVKAFGRLEDGGPLVILSSVTTEVGDEGVSAVSLEPRVSWY